MRPGEQERSVVTIIKAALFLDFDNFFSGLMTADPISAMELAKSPSRWLHKLRTRYSDGDERRWLVLRCYMNPAGSLPDPGKPGERVYFSKLRPFFTQAGVEVVDCPALTKGSKNGADIRIVIDVMTALSSNTRYDEFVLASADADFTPLLQVLRADDRRITVIATSSTATAYESLADRFLDEQDIFELSSLDPETDSDINGDQTAPELDGHAPPTADLGPALKAETGYDEFVREVRSIYSKANDPINLARLSSDLKAASGAGLEDGTWYGARTFVRALQMLELPNAQFSQYHLWDPTRHIEPLASMSAPRPALPATVMHFPEVTGMPTLSSSHWPVVFETLATYAAMHVFNFTEASKWSRDQVAGQGLEIPRRAFSFVVRACRDGGANLNADPSPDAAAIARAFFISVLRQAELAGLEVDESEKQELAAWLHCDSGES